MSTWVQSELPYPAAVGCWDLSEGREGESGSGDNPIVFFYIDSCPSFCPPSCTEVLPCAAVGRRQGTLIFPRSQHEGTLQGVSLCTMPFNLTKNMVSTCFRIGKERPKLEGMDPKHAASTASCESELSTSLFLSPVFLGRFFPFPLWCQDLLREEGQILMFFISW